MRNSRLLTFLLLASLALAGESAPDGLSKLGSAFDSGPRQKPWRITGLGKVHFSITTSAPDAQEWFDQGVALLHVFFYNEAERTFRWVAKLDPDCAMAYWDMAASTFDKERRRRFLEMASSRKDNVSERERRWIEAWEARTDPESPEELIGNVKAGPKREHEYTQRLERLILDYPNDIEAKAFYGLDCFRRTRTSGLSDGPHVADRYACETVLQQVLQADPNHPGAHHYRVHNWDGPDAGVALDSARQLGRIATDSGHALHMPGHIFGGLGRWHEAAIAQDIANRTELSYQRDHRMLPTDSWNYRHNRNYLCYVQEQLGKAKQAIRGARELARFPGLNGAPPLQRALIKFEHWKELLADDGPRWGDESVWDRMERAYGRTLAHLGLDGSRKAHKEFEAFARLKAEVDEGEDWIKPVYKIKSLELRGRLALAGGDDHRGLRLLTEAAEAESEHREQANDPPDYANFLYTVLGREYLARRSPQLAATAFEKTLASITNDGFALAGLVEAYLQLDENGKAQEAYTRLLRHWSRADPDLKWLRQARAAAQDAGLSAQSKHASAAPQRIYEPDALAAVGPSELKLNPAPPLKAPNSRGEQITLQDYRGENVLLIFFVSGDCEDCVEQLSELAERQSDLVKKHTRVVAVCPEEVERIVSLKEKADIDFAMLSDREWVNGRRFKSYDDFEEMALNSTILIDRQGRVVWAHYGGKPYKEFDRLIKEIDAANAGAE